MFSPRARQRMRAREHTYRAYLPQFSNTPPQGDLEGISVCIPFPSAILAHLTGDSLMSPTAPIRMALVKLFVVVRPIR